jgi:extracellular factor (EF) 3-hydroxypalmitic acid methyl ester biosynthesis protein
MVQPISLEGRSFTTFSDQLDVSLDESVRARLDEHESALRGGDTFAAMDALIGDLSDLRRSLHRNDWKTLAAEVINQHPIADLVRQCPLTDHCAAKPRGYAGDAELIDHIYGLGLAARAPHPATLAGRIYAWNVNTPGCRAARRRREIIASEIDKVAARQSSGRASMLSIACGHLREADLAVAFRSGAIGQFVALDQDRDSLAEVERSYAHLGVEAQVGTVRSIIARKTAFSGMDFVYAAGLYDYLVAPIGMRLAARLFEFLRPGGRLLIANFSPSLPGIGYMETFMDWWLIYRTGAELRALFDEVPGDEVAGIDVFEDEIGAIVYAAVEKRV